MEFTLLGGAFTSEVAVLVRAALVAAVILGLEALSHARKRKQASTRVVRAKYVARKSYQKHSAGA